MIPKNVLFVNIVLIFFLSALIFSGCRKSVAEEQTYQAMLYASTEQPGKMEVITYTPGDNDSLVNIYAHVKVVCNKTFYSRRIKFSKFVLSGPEGNVEGKYIYTDTSGEFIPHVNLKTNTEYKVLLEGFVTRQIDSETNPFTESFEKKIVFRTSDTSEYIMERRSQHVTAFARDGSEMVQVGNYLYLYGGWHATDSSASSYNDIYRSSGDLSTWERLPDAPWQGRHTFGLGKLGDNIFVFGGDHLTDYFDVWKSTDGMNFTSVVQDLDNTVQSRLVYGTCTHNNKLYILGGQRTLDDYVGFTDVWTSPNGYAWRRLTNDESFLGKNISGSVASFNGKIYVIGGGNYRHPDTALRWTNHVYSSPDGKTWTREPDAPWTGRQYADVCVWDNKLWMIGGHNGGNLAEIWYMNTDGSWVEYEPSILFTARHASAVAVYNDQLVMACGDLNNECWVIRRP